MRRGDVSDNSDDDVLRSQCISQRLYNHTACITESCVDQIKSLERCLVPFADPGPTTRTSPRSAAERLKASTYLHVRKNGRTSSHAADSCTIR